MTIYKVKYITNNPRAALQASGAVLGITLGWLTTKSIIGGMIGGMLGLLFTTLTLEVMEAIASAQISSITSTVRTAQLRQVSY